MVKISFSGIPGSGKTEVLAEVKKILSLRFRVEELEDLSARNPFDADQVPEFALAFFRFSSQINNENLKRTRPLDFLLCDRSVIDHWIDWRLRRPQKEENPQLERRNQVLRNLFSFWSASYDAVFHIRSSYRDLQTRIAGSEKYDLDEKRCQELESAYMEVFSREGVTAWEIWNRNSIDESAHQLIQKVVEAGLL